MPTHPEFWGRPRGMGKQSTHAPVPIRRGSGHGTYAWWFEQRGRPVAGEGSGLDIASGDGYGGSRTGAYERRGRVTPAEQRALTSGMLSKMVRTR